MNRFTKKIVMAVGIYVVFAIIFIILFHTTFMNGWIPSSKWSNFVYNYC